MTAARDLVTIRRGNVEMYKKTRERLLAELAETEEAIEFWTEKLAEVQCRCKNADACEVCS